MEFSQIVQLLASPDYEADFQATLKSLRQVGVPIEPMRNLPPIVEGRVHYAFKSAYYGLGFAVQTQEDARLLRQAWRDLREAEGDNDVAATLAVELYAARRLGYAPRRSITRRLYSATIALFRVGPVPDESLLQYTQGEARALGLFR